MQWFIRLTCNSYIKTYNPMECCLLQCSPWKQRPVQFLKPGRPMIWFMNLVGLFGNSSELLPILLLSGWSQSYFQLQCWHNAKCNHYLGFRWLIFDFHALQQLLCLSLNISQCWDKIYLMLHKIQFPCDQFIYFFAQAKTVLYWEKQIKGTHCHWSA